MSNSGPSVWRMRPIRSGSRRTHSLAGKTIAATAALATARNSTTQMKAASGDGTRRRSSHSSTGTSAIAITRAAVTGRKNSAPARSANGSASRNAGAEDQGDRGEQPVAPIGGRLGLDLERRLECFRGLALSLSLIARDNARPRAPLRSDYHVWCPWPDSNGHSLRNSILSPARLPIPPQGHEKGAST